MSDIDTNRLRNWAKAYQRLMEGGLSVEAHTACVDDFAADDGEFPYITADDVLELLDRLAAAEGAVEEVRRAFDPGELDCGRIGMTCRDVHTPDRWCRACRITNALDPKEQP